MIIPNGTIEFIFDSTHFCCNEGDVLDENGYPIVPDKAYGEAIPCQYLPNGNNLGRSNGEAFTKIGCTIYIESVRYMELPSERIRLKDRMGKVLGEFSVVSSETLDAVCQTKIVI